MNINLSIYEQTLYDFVGTVLVVCPECHEQASVTSKSLLIKAENDVVLTCPHCGLRIHYSKSSESNSSAGPIDYARECLVFGTNVDPYFRYPLWLVKEFTFCRLWAYNYEHLSLIEKHLRARLRIHRTKRTYHKNKVSRLPRWFNSKKNQELVLKAIEDLKK